MYKVKSFTSHKVGPIGLVHCTVCLFMP